MRCIQMQDQQPERSILQCSIGEREQIYVLYLTLKTKMDREKHPERMTNVLHEIRINIKFRKQKFDLELELNK